MKSTHDSRWTGDVLQPKETMNHLSNLHCTQNLMLYSLLQSGNLSERNAGMGPKAVEATKTRTPVKNIFSAMLSDW